MVYTYIYSHENQYVIYLTQKKSLRATCYRVPNLTAAQKAAQAGLEAAADAPAGSWSG